MGFQCRKLFVGLAWTRCHTSGQDGYTKEAGQAITTTVQCPKMTNLVPEHGALSSSSIKDDRMISIEKRKALNQHRVSVQEVYAL